MQLTNLIKKLASFEPDGFPFISLYLNTEKNEHGRETFQVWLKKELSARQKAYSDNPFEGEKFEKAAARIQDYLENEEHTAAHGVAIFTSLGDESFFEAVQLKVAFPENFFFSFDRPHIFPVARAISQNPKYAVLWADTNKADIYVFGGENRIRSDNEANDRVENIQNRFTNRTQVGGWSQARFQRHIDNFHLQHAKETVAELEEIVREKDIEYLILCGDEATIMPILRPQLSKALEEKVIGALHLSQYDSTDEIHEKTREVLGIERATRNKAQVDRVRGAANAAAGLGTLGVKATLQALSGGQVQELVISSDFDAIKYAPNEVSEILNNYAPGDDQSSLDTMPIVEFPGEVADELIIRAINSDAKIIFIEDESLLKDVGGVGAILRFNMSAGANG